MHRFYNIEWVVDLDIGNYSVCYLQCVLSFHSRDRLTQSDLKANQITNNNMKHKQKKNK